MDQQSIHKKHLTIKLKMDEALVFMVEFKKAYDNLKWDVLGKGFGDMIYLGFFELAWFFFVGEW